MCGRCVETSRYMIPVLLGGYWSLEYRPPESYYYDTTPTKLSHIIIEIVYLVQ